MNEDDQLLAALRGSSDIPVPSTLADRTERRMLDTLERRVRSRKSPSRPAWLGTLELSGATALGAVYLTWVFSVVFSV